jgi:hypothetical protein
VLYGLGVALSELGRAQEARDAWLTAVPIFGKINDPRAGELRARLGGAALG